MPSQKAVSRKLRVDAPCAIRSLRHLWCPQNYEERIVSYCTSTSVQARKEKKSQLCSVSWTPHIERIREKFSWKVHNYLFAESGKFLSLLFPICVQIVAEIRITRTQNGRPFELR